jgi:serine/threonine protein kinase
MTSWEARKRVTSESNPHRLCALLTINRNRYLILDVLGQGTFGQVVKCQNMKTQEVVAVKVIKNKTAYFNQSMMEVSVLDLVGFPRPILRTLAHAVIIAQQQI